MLGTTMMINTNIRWLIIFLFAMVSISSIGREQSRDNDNTGAAQELSRESDYVLQWADFKTELIKKEKSFQRYKEFENKQDDIQSVSYQSGSLTLKGLINTKNIALNKKRPVIVYLHGGFALSYNDMKQTQRFVDQGFIVFAPSYRGENGNPGYFELFMGEVEDAKAAINWISKQSYVDPKQIYTFGWSVGGGISLNLSLHPNLPVRMGASSAGVYDHGLIKAWATEDDMIIFPYDYTNEKENYFRLPIYNLKNMTRKHFVYIGQEDGFEFVNNLNKQLYADTTTKMTLTKVNGDHVSSLGIAMEAFMSQIKELPPIE
jgi:acetyl esterase/lipase